MGGGPHTTWNNEELTLTITGLGGGYSLQNLGELRLFDYAQVQFPHDWDDFKIGATTHIVEWTWQANSWLILDTTLGAGIDWSRPDGAGGSMQVDSELKAHLMQRPTASLDFTLHLTLDGTADHSGFHGTGSANAGLTLTF
jgi:hypothetical protein